MRQNALRLMRAAGAVREAMASAGPKVAEAGLSTRAAIGSTRALASLSRSTKQAAPFSIALANAMQQASISSSAQARMALAEVPVDGDLQKVLAEIDAIVSAESCTAKEVADAAVALAYMQAKGDRRIWGKVFEKAGAVKGSFDAASLTAFMWAATTAGVSHFKTIAEMSGPAAALLGSMTPAQVSTVVEALGKAGCKDAELFGKVGAAVTAGASKYSGAELARTLWGFAAAGAADGAMAKAVSAALVAKAGELSGREAVQAVWALAKMRRTDKPALDALVKAAKAKLGSIESPIDVAALAWSLGFLSYKLDSSTASALSGTLAKGASELSPAHAIDAAWGLGVLGVNDAAATKALLDVAASAIAANPNAVHVYQAGALHNAAVMLGGKLPEQVSAFALKMYSLGGAAMAVKTSAAGTAFKADLAAATAYAFGARYRPEIAAAVKGFAVTTPEGISVCIALESGGAKVAVEAVHPCNTSATHPGVALGPAVARAKLLEAAGYKVVPVSMTEWAAQGDDKTKAAAVLKAAKAAGVNVSAAEAALAKPFDAYA
ncbi:hypothetical protein FOA52_008789 [Chlamydomonas sp. UWO 241]|nr:hypothetical protein FOA52_008789 [Chlamydomonas sp. UWO 241]